MHDTAYEIGGEFLKLYWAEGFRDVLDVGSRDVTGTLRDFRPGGARYTGMDMEAGEGVDVVAEDPAVFPFEDEAFDVIVSTSALEHDPMFWLTFAEMERVLRPGGFIYINAPSNGNYHTYPMDNWRFYPDAGVSLEQWARRLGKRVTLVESFTARRKNNIWCDFVMIFVKGAKTAAERTVYLSQRFSDSFNIRHGAEAAVENFSREPEDLKLVTALEARVEALASAAEEAEVLRLRVTDLEARLEDVYASRSWRFTRAGRRFSNWLRGRRGSENLDRRD